MAKRAGVKGECFFCIPLECGLKFTGFMEVIFTVFFLILYSMYLAGSIENDRLNGFTRKMMEENAGARYGIPPSIMAMVLTSCFFITGVVLLLGIYMANTAALKCVWILKLVIGLYCLANVVANIILYYNNGKSMVYTTIGHFVFVTYFAYRVREYEKKLQRIIVVASPC